MHDIDVLRQMYATLCGGIDVALTLLGNGRVWEAGRTLQGVLDLAEELYIAGERSIDELEEYRRS